jgi:hypothetical protein
MLSASASLGLSLLWDTDALSHVDSYTYYSEEYIKVVRFIFLDASDVMLITLHRLVHY